MKNRGVTRSMGGHTDHGPPYSEMRYKMLKMHHQQTGWIYWLLVMLGFITILNPLTFSPDIGVVSPSGGRELWLTLEQRLFLMKWSDILSGAGLVFFGWRALKPDRPISILIACFIGVWMTFAPILFWSPTAHAYIFDTLVGALVIALTILIPGMPNMVLYMKMGSEVPKGWTYNPSSWPQRWIMIVTGFLGWLVSRYLAAYQLGFIDQVWDPFFGEGSRLVLDSKMSHSLPVSDAGLGTIAYTFEFLMGFMGSPSRWRTMPWMVTFFGILVIPLGLVHIFLVISQPVIVGHWCTFCIAAAAIMLPMIPLEIDEVIAMGQHIRQRMKKGDSFWKVFWKGGMPVTENSDERTPELAKFSDQTWPVIKASLWGMSVPVSLLISTFAGIFIMAMPGIFGIGKPVSDIYHLGGALTVVVSVICMGEVVRAGRFLNILLGGIIAFLPFFIGETALAVKVAGLLAGVLIIALAFPKGPQKEHYGSWDKFVR